MKDNALISVRGLEKSFGKDIQVLKGIDIDIFKGDVVVVLGPSGSGKSTFLRCLNRLEEPTGGHIFFEGTDITDPKVNINVHRQKMGMVFQQFNLFPHKTVIDNLTMAPVKLLGKSKDEAKKLLDETCKSIYALDKLYDMSKYKTPEIDTTTSRPRFMGDVKVVRDGKEITLENVQFFTYYADEDAEKENKPTVAFDFAVEPIEKNVGTVLGETFTQTCSMAKTVWTSLVWLVQGRFTFNDMSGPVGIATAVTQVASMGLQTGFVDAVNNILFVMILITVNLGIVNMLPFPALDGGRFLFLLIEWIFKKPIPRKAEQIVNTVGLVLLLAFMLIISVKDVFQLVTGTFPGM